MAITKIWSVKSRLDTSLKYIANPDKTTLQPDIEAVEGVIKYIKNNDIYFNLFIHIIILLFFFNFINEIFITRKT